MYKPSLHMGRLLAPILIIELTLPTSALGADRDPTQALRTQQCSRVRAGLEEALRSGNPDDA